MVRYAAPILALLSIGPCLGYTAYLWREKRRAAAIGVSLPCAFAAALAVAMFFFL